jgi:uncharacterized damage-inducible protein DinB
MSDYKNATETFLNSFKDLEDAAFTFSPGENQWSVARVVEHLNIADKSAYIAMIRTSGEPNADQLELSGRKVNLMLNRENRKYTAPESVEPKGIFTNASEAAAIFMKTRNRIQDFAEKENLDLLATGLEHPRLGLLTRQQWIAFLAWHAQHHAEQIQRILAGTQG